MNPQCIAGNESGLPNTSCSNNLECRPFGTVGLEAPTYAVNGFLWRAEKLSYIVIALMGTYGQRWTTIHRIREGWEATGRGY